MTPARWEGVTVRPTTDRHIGERLPEICVSRCDGYHLVLLARCQAERHAGDPSVDEPPR
jgi:hypothetical protein